MAELSITDDSIRRINIAATVLVSAAAIGIAYWLDRVHRVWWEGIDPLAVTRARVEDARIGYRRRRANVTDAAGAIRELLEIAGSASSRMRP